MASYPPGTITDVKEFEFGIEVISAINNALDLAKNESDGVDLSAYKLESDTLLMLIPLPDGRALVGVNKESVKIVDGLSNFRPILLDSAAILFGEGCCVGALSLGGGYTVVVKRDRSC